MLKPDGWLMAMNKRTRAVTLIQTFLIVGLVSGLWFLDTKDQAFLGLTSFHDASQMEKRILRTGKHNVLLIPAERWQGDLIRRMEARGALANELMAGRLTLLQAAEGFRDLDACSPAFDLKSFRQHAIGNSDVERYCGLVITVVESQLNIHYDDYATEVVTRLEKELDRHIRAGTLYFSPTYNDKPIFPGKCAATGRRKEPVFHQGP